MSIELSPQAAAALADWVYKTRNNDNSKGAISAAVIGDNLNSNLRKMDNTSADVHQLPIDISNEFDFDKGVVIKGSGFAGGSFAEGFGWVVPGQRGRSGEALLLCRGTVGTSNWITDIDAAGVDLYGATVHTGFCFLFESMRRDVENALGAVAPTLLHIVGHSLGGATANLFALHFRMKGYSVKLYTFGSPRVGRREFYDMMDRKVGKRNAFRVFNTYDPVPDVPCFPYMHWPGTADDAYHIKGAHHWNLHGMTNYRSTIGSQTWGGLLRASRTVDEETEMFARLLVSDPKSAFTRGRNGGQIMSKAFAKTLAKSASRMAWGGGVILPLGTLVDRLLFIAALKTHGKQIGRDVLALLVRMHDDARGAAARMHSGGSAAAAAAASPDASSPSAPAVDEDIDQIAAAAILDDTIAKLRNAAENAAASELGSSEVMQ